MPRLPAAAVIFSLAAAPAVQAAEFSWEPSGFASRFDQGSVEERRYSVAATRFFAPVDDAAGPYGLATFLDPATRVSAAVDRERRTTPVLFFGPPLFGPLPPPVSNVTETDEYSFGGRYVFPESKWYAGGSYRRGDAEDAPIATLADTDLEGYGALVGKYLGASTTLELAYDSSETRTQYPVSCAFPFVCSGDSSTTTRTEEWDLAAQHVLRGRALTYSLTGRIAETDGELTIRSPRVTLDPSFIPRPLPPSLVGIVGGVGPVGGVVAFGLPSDVEVDLGELRVYSVGGELFPTQRFGVRIGYSRWDGDSVIDDAYDVTATWFVTRNVGLAFTLSRQDFKYSVDDGDTAALRIVGRL